MTLALIVYEGWTLSELGIRFDNVVPSIIPYTIFTILGVLALVAIAKIIKRTPQKNFYSNKKFIYSIIVISILQELLFRGFLFPKLNYIFSNYTIIILANVILFTFMHTIYSNTTATLATIFAGGIFFALVYGSYPNLILISLSHIILNHVAVRYGFYREENNMRKNRGVNRDIYNA